MQKNLVQQIGQGVASASEPARTSGPCQASSPKQRCPYRRPMRAVPRRRWRPATRPRLR